MSEFKAATLCILGRQPKLGLAELESLYGSEHVKALGEHALLDIPAEEIEFKRLGGTIKVTKILAELPYHDWPRVLEYLVRNIPKHLQNLPDGKFTLGVSAYDLDIPVKTLNQGLLEIKKIIKKTGRPVRVVPNKTAHLNSAQVLHNRLTNKGAWELVLVGSAKKTLLTQTLFVQDIDAYAARDQARPKRDARVGMLPPKLAQIIINLAVGKVKPEDAGRVRILDPFCGTGVVLQEAMLMGYHVMGSDIDPRMVDYTRENLKWLVGRYPALETSASVELGDATNHQWPRFSTIASEVFLGRPLNALPAESKLREIISDANVITKKFLENLSGQLRPGQKLCLALPAWRHPDGRITRLPLLDQLTDMGYNYLDLKHVRRQDLLYYREDQVVARQLIRLEKV